MSTASRRVDAPTLGRIQSPRMQRLNALESMLRDADNRSRGPFQGQEHFGSGDPMARGPMESRVDAGRAEMRQREMDGGWNLQRPAERPPMSDPFGPSSAAFDAYMDGPRPGNIDLRQQPKVNNPDGSVSTVDSRSYGLDGSETLLPSVTSDGRHLSADDDIVGEYRRTGRHLGRFESPDQADAYARRLHDDYAAGRYSRSSVDPFADEQGVRINNPGEMSRLPMRDSSNGYALSDERAKQDVYRMGYEQGLSRAVGYGGARSDESVQGPVRAPMEHGFDRRGPTTHSFGYEIRPGPTEPGEVMDPRWRRALAQQDDYIRRNTDIRTGVFRPNAGDRGGPGRHFQDMRRDAPQSRREIADLRAKRETQDIERTVAGMYDAERAQNRSDDARMLGLTPEVVARQDRDAQAQYERRLAREEQLRAEFDAEYRARSRSGRGGI
jgi:hypothetical protein